MEALKGLGSSQRFKRRTVLRFLLSCANVIDTNVYI